MSEITQKRELSQETIVQVLREILKPEYAEVIFGMDQGNNCQKANIKHEILLEENGKVTYKTITELFKRIGMPANILGFKYCREAIIYADTHEIKIAGKELYPVIAEKFNTTSSSVERCIRNAIDVVFYRGDIEVLGEIFGSTVDCKVGKPSNKEFIAMMLEYLNI